MHGGPDRSVCTAKKPHTCFSKEKEKRTKAHVCHDKCATQKALAAIPKWIVPLKDIEPETRITPMIHRRWDPRYPFAATYPCNYAVVPPTVPPSLATDSKIREDDRLVQSGGAGAADAAEDGVI